MTVHRRRFLQIGLGAGAAPLLLRVPASSGQQGSLDARAVETLTLRARALATPEVRLTDGPLAHAQRLDADYLLELEPDRMLAYFRQRAGLAPKAEGYGGWDGDGRNLTGHIAGHWLSGASLMWAATGDARLREQVDYVVAELREVQEAHGDGYLCALENGRRCFDELARGEIRSAAFDLNGEWAPWYTMHKVYAGLRDAYRYTGNRTALEVEIALAAWAEGVLGDLSEEQIQHMLNTEFGGMNEVLVDLYVDTGDARWLDLSWKFEHRKFIEPLQRHQDNLAGIHGNTQIPKLVGSADRYAATGNAGDLLAASFFWDRVVHHHSFASGGHGKDEYFGPPDHLSARIDGRTAETCNVYNMLKLTRRLFELRPDAAYADFHERALFNHILASIDPDDGATCYMVPVGRGVQREYQNMQRSFTCCVGSGLESHALHGDGLYYHDGDRLWVNQFAPSTARWSEAGVSVEAETDFPLGESARLRLGLATPREMTVAVRRPYWVGAGFAVAVNGEPIDVSMPEPRARDAEGNVPDDPTDPRGLRRYESDVPVSTYVEIRRLWRAGDVIELRLPKTLRLEPLADNPNRASILWGPLVLAGDLGPEIRRGRQTQDEEGEQAPPVTVPVIVGRDRPVEEWLKPVSGSPGHFRLEGAGREPDATDRERSVELSPMYALHRRLYTTYWDVFTPAEWEEERADYAAEAERVRRLEAATVAYLEPGETIFDRPFNLQAADDSVPARLDGRPGRRGDSWFSYDVPVEPDRPMAMILTFHSDDRRGSPGTFDILVDGSRVVTQHVGREEPPRFYDVELAIPAELTRGKDTVTVRFEARPDDRIATIFGLRVIRVDSPR
jgi:DUF1680 family protein